MQEGAHYSFGENIPADSLTDLERDMLFYQKRKKGKVRPVISASLPGPVADTHAHLDMLKDPGLALARSAYHGVDLICTIMDIHEDDTTTFEKLPVWRERASEVYARYGLGDLRAGIPRVRVAIGCHPHNAKHYGDVLHARLEEILHDPMVAAIGEVGLDYHYDHSPRPAQREAFKRQIELAHIAGLPLILHMRKAHDEGYAILEEQGFPEAGVLLHCFNLDPDTLRPWAEKGCYIAFGGPLTFKNMPEVRLSAREVPIDRLLTETDSPFMTPEPLRGIECTPDMTIFTAKKLLEIEGIDTEEQQKRFLDQLFMNACTLLDREPTSWQIG